MDKAIKEVIDYIKNKYDNEACGYTEEISEGNYSDVFNDGYACGESDILYTIGKILGVELEEPKEQQYSWE